MTDSEYTQQLHHFTEEGADLPTMLTARPEGQPGGEVYSMSSRQQEITLGRGSHCDVVLADDRVSRLHAVVRLMGSRAVIEDAGSTNGTYVDGVRIDTPVELREGSMVRFGRRGPVFRYGRNFGRSATPPAPPGAAGGTVHRPPAFGNGR